MSEDYWKEDDGTLLEQWEYRSKTVRDDPKLLEDLTKCSSLCSKDNKARSLVPVGRTINKGVVIYLCPVCDGSALDLARREGNS